MPATANGIYHNLRESKYTISNGEIVFSFSSRLYMNKFLRDYKHHRITCMFRGDWQGKPLNLDTVADIVLYEKLEKRGFFVRMITGNLKSSLLYDDVYKYALRKMSVKESPKWVVT
jgi:hypothetical protein